MDKEFKKTEIFHGLVCITGQNGFFDGKTLNIRAGDTVTIGRDRGSCTLLFPPDHDAISGTHCGLRYNAARNAIELTDMESKNGTFTGDGNKLAPGVAHELKDGDSFYLAVRENTFTARII